MHCCPTNHLKQLYLHTLTRSHIIRIVLILKRKYFLNQNQVQNESLTNPLMFHQGPPRNERKKLIPNLIPNLN